MKILPDVNTKEMSNAGGDVIFNTRLSHVDSSASKAYKAMVAAAPLYPDLAILPKELTAENGMKRLLIGEFSEIITFPCPDCDEDESYEGCEICHGNSEYDQKVDIEWTTIKDIYKMIVKHWEEKE